MVEEKYSLVAMTHIKVVVIGETRGSRVLAATWGGAGGFVRVGDVATPQRVQLKGDHQSGSAALCWLPSLSNVPLEHGRDYYFVLLPVSRRLVALEPRRVICIHRPILWWVESLSDVSLPIWSPFVGLGVIRFSTPSLSSPPSLAVLRH